jgi:SAM-dependent methyltransferase
MQKICHNCGFILNKTANVWHALTPEQQKEYSAFLHDYEEIRRQEGRGADESAFYLALPFQDLSGHFTWQWKIRAKSFLTLKHRVFPELELCSQGQPLRILDLGAGNGWLSYRLALEGHLPIAVDLSVSPLDGLKATHHYQSALSNSIPCFQASMDHLPFADAQFDLAIFNASFHYSANYQHTLAEALRCLHKQGIVLIVDSPTYSSTLNGLMMLSERRKEFETKYGFRSDSLNSQEFLTPEMLETLEDLGIRWQVICPWYGFAWAMRPWIARVQRRREPAKFFIYVGHVKRS